MSSKRRRVEGLPAPLAKFAEAARAVGRVTPRRLPSPANLYRKKGFPYTKSMVPRGVTRRADEPSTGADYDTDWARRPTARAARGAILEGLVRPAVNRLARPEVDGLDRLAALDDDDPVIFVANHHSHIDTPLMLSVIPAPRRYKVAVGAAADYFFTSRRASAFFALTLGAFPIERTKVGRKSAHLAESLLHQGYSLILFPEGGRSPDGWGQPFRGGAAFLAARSGAAVIPVHIDGTSKILGKGNKFPKPGRTRVTFGSPIIPAADDDARSLGPRIERAVAVLADEAITDWWSARKRAASGDTPPLTGPKAVSGWRRQWALGDTTTRRSQKRQWPKV